VPAPAAPAPAAPIVITPAPAPAPSIVFAPPAPAAPAQLVARPATPPAEGEKKTNVVEKETVTVIVVVPPVIVPEPQLPPAEITTQIIAMPEPQVMNSKVMTRLVAKKLPVVKGSSAMSFALTLFDQASNKAITDSDLVAGVKVLSKTPKVCTVSTSLDSGSGKYVLRVKGVSNGQCRIAAVDKGNEVKSGSSLLIEHSITTIAKKKS
jgi:hypothetical protein